MSISELIKLCDEIDACSNKLCWQNEIVCVRKILEQYIGSDKNKLLKIRAQIKINDTYKSNLLDYTMKLISVFTFVLTIIYNLTREDILLYGIYALMAMGVIVLISFLGMIYRKRESSRDKWIRYIEVVLEDIAKEKGW